MDDTVRYCPFCDMVLYGTEKYSSPPIECCCGFNLLVVNDHKEMERLDWWLAYYNEHELPTEEELQKDIWS